MFNDRKRSRMHLIYCWSVPLNASQLTLRDDATSGHVVIFFGWRGNFTLVGKLSLLIRHFDMTQFLLSNYSYKLFIIRDIVLEIVFLEKSLFFSLSIKL